MAELVKSVGAAISATGLLIAFLWLVAVLADS